MTDPYLVRRLDHPLLGDAYLAAIAASGATFALLGWGLLMGLLCGIALGVPAIFLTTTVHRALARHDPRGHRSRLLACLALALVVAAVASVSLDLTGLLIGLAVFLVLAGRVQLRERAVARDRQLSPATTGPALPGERR